MSKYKKDEIINSESFRHDKDLLKALIKKDEMLSKEEIEIKLKNYKERKI
ncbi:MAG: hypothetical protein R3Y33_08910 [Clostridia bacterium]